jgi:hypothetical protein
MPHEPATRDHLRVDPASREATAADPGTRATARPGAGAGPTAAPVPVPGALSRAAGSASRAGPRDQSPGINLAYSRLTTA